MKAYHFTGEKLRDGSPIPDVGKWLTHKGELVMCESGLHASKDPLDALKYAPGQYLHLVELGGRIIEGDDKCVASKRRIVASIDATKLLREFARWCALQVIHLWDAPEVVKRYLETGDENIMDAARDAARNAARAAAWAAAWAAARDAAWAAAWDAARDAAWDAARNAARAAARDADWAAARDAQRKKFNQMVRAAFTPRPRRERSRAGL